MLHAKHVLFATIYFLLTFLLSRSAVYYSFDLNVGSSGNPAKVILENCIHGWNYTAREGRGGRWNSCNFKLSFTFSSCYTVEILYRSLKPTNHPFITMNVANRKKIAKLFLMQSKLNFCSAIAFDNLNFYTGISSPTESGRLESVICLIGKNLLINSMCLSTRSFSV